MPMATIFQSRFCRRWLRKRRSEEYQRNWRRRSVAQQLVYFPFNPDLKTTTQVRECYNVLARARLLHGRLDAQHVESASKALGDSYKVTLYSQRKASSIS
jgi:hypothetical protein